MRVAEIWRYPVKSLQGERVDAVPVTPEGLLGDRRYAIFDTATGFGLTARRLPVLLYATARWRADESVEITLPDGRIAADDDALSGWLGRPVVLRSSAEVITRRYENPDDFENEPASQWGIFDGSRGAFHDGEAANVSLLSRSTMRDWAPRRFRANLVLDTPGEDGLVGSSVTVGDALLSVGTRIVRCVMTTRPQPGGIGRDLDVLRTILRERDGCLAVGARVVRPGTVQTGDEVRVAANAVASVS